MLQALMNYKMEKRSEIEPEPILLQETLTRILLQTTRKATGSGSNSRSHMYEVNLIYNEQRRGLRLPTGTTYLGDV